MLIYYSRLNNVGTALSLSGSWILRWSLFSFLLQLNEHMQIQISHNHYVVVAPLKYFNIWFFLGAVDDRTYLLFRMICSIILVVYQENLSLRMYRWQFNVTSLHETFEQVGYFGFWPRIGTWRLFTSGFGVSVSVEMCELKLNFFCHLLNFCICLVEFTFYLASSARKFLKCHTFWRLGNFLVWTGASWHSLQKLVSISN